MNMTSRRKLWPAVRALLGFVSAVVVPTLVVLGVVALGPLGIAFAGDQRGERHQSAKSPETLYIWAGDQARVAPDFLAVIVFDEDSPDYGRVIKTVPVLTACTVA